MRVLITDGVHEFLISNLQNAGHEVLYLPKIELEEVKKIIKGFEVIVINTKTKMDREMIDLAENLKLIVRLGSGLDIIDLDYCAEKNIIVKNTPEGNRNAVAEHALGMLLGLLNNIVISSNQVKQFQWLREQNRGIEIEGKTIGIIGFGNTGSTFAKLLRGFDVEVLAYDKYKQGFADDLDYVTEVDMKTIFKECDILSLHIPLTDETNYLVNDDFINGFDKNIFIVNTSRGKIIDTDALIEGLDSGKIVGAALDVLENEKIKILDDKQKKQYKNILNRENVIVTPHIAGWTFESKFKIAKAVYDNINNLF